MSGFQSIRTLQTWVKLYNHIPAFFFHFEIGDNRVVTVIQKDRISAQLRAWNKALNQVFL